MNIIFTQKSQGTSHHRSSMDINENKIRMTNRDIYMHNSFILTDILIHITDTIEQNILHMTNLIKIHNYGGILYKII